MTTTAIVAAFLAAAQLAAAPVEPPSCGRRDHDIGQGFRLTQYMFDGLPDFSLDYRPPAKSLTAEGVTETGSLRLTFRQLTFRPWTGGEADFAGPRLGYRDFEFKTSDGQRIWSRTTSLDCGGGVQLKMTASNATAPVLKGPITFPEPFFKQPLAQCVEAIRSHGRIRMVLTDADNRPAVIIEDDVPLQWAIAEAERLWQADKTRAEAGLCRMSPPLPPIPVLAPPPPPKAPPG